jgi:DNA polymerase-3 subunit gamma/tau
MIIVRNDQWLGGIKLSLYQKHRPQSFDEIVGNQSVVGSLQALVAKVDPPHAYLLLGPTGCGKTTIGRILMTELGCHFDDTREIDTADFRGIETARTIRHNAHYKALRGERRAWLIDECHKLTNDAQNALLKGLEDPPPHCYYILCTTDPDKLLDTIRGRCSIHSVRPLTIPQMVGLLGKVSAKEKAPLSRKVLNAIALKAAIQTGDKEDSAECYPRHALQILEQVIVASPEDQLKIVEEASDLVASADKLVNELLKKSGWKAITNILKDIKDDDVERLRRGVLGYCNGALMRSDNEIAANIIFHFKTPFFDSGMAGLTLACFAVLKG